MVTAELAMYAHVLGASRLDRGVAREAMGTKATDIRPRIAWMRVSCVYVKSLTTTSRSAAAREMARKPLAASGIADPAAVPTTHEPKPESSRLLAPKCASPRRPRSPMTRSALPSSTGLTSSPIEAAWYWLSPSVLTMTSARSRSAASRPRRKARASPSRAGARTMWVTPARRATATVSSVEPSSITRTSMDVNPGSDEGSCAIVAASVPSSLWQGIWITSRTVRVVPRFAAAAKLPARRRGHAREPEAAVL